MCQRWKGVELVGFIGVGGGQALAMGDAWVRHCVDTMSTQRRCVNCSGLDGKNNASGCEEGGARFSARSTRLGLRA